MIYNFLFTTGVGLLDSSYVDVRDVARAHIGALESKPDKNNRKRLILFSPHRLTDKHILDVIKKEHPELERRFITAKPVSEFPTDLFDVDFERIREVTGMCKEDFHTSEEVWLYMAV